MSHSHRPTLRLFTNLVVCCNYRIVSSQVDGDCGLRHSLSSFLLVYLLSLSPLCLAGLYVHVLIPWNLIIFLLILNNAVIQPHQTVNIYYQSDKSVT